MRFYTRSCGAPLGLGLNPRHDYSIFKDLRELRASDLARFACPATPELGSFWTTPFQVRCALCSIFAFGEMKASMCWRRTSRLARSWTDLNVWTFRSTFEASARM